MAAISLKQKVQRSIDVMNESELRSAYIILQTINNGKQEIAINKNIVEVNISNGLAELNNGLGREFPSFLSAIKTQYGSKK